MSPENTPLSQENPEGKPSSASASSSLERVSFLNEKFEKPEPVYNEKISKNFLGSTIIKRIDGTHFAVRKNNEGIWEGNSFKLTPDGDIGATYHERTIDPEIITAVENIQAMTVPTLNRDLMKIGMATREEKALFVNEKKNFSSEASIDLYHGLNGGIEGALKVLESPSQGVKQISGPCLALYPVGQFWKPGDAGFKYSIPRGQIEFPGESNPLAQFRVDEGGTVLMINGLDTLPLSEFNGIVMTTERKRDVIQEKVIDGVLEDVVVGQEVVPLTYEERKIGKEIQKKLQELSDIRS